MADENKNPEIEEENPSGSEEQVKLEGGTYEIIKARLNKQASELRQRLDKLNVERKKVFGAIELKLVGNSRINTENNCIARDIFSVGNLCILGYNVHMGLRSEVKLNDVFSVYRFNGEMFEEATLEVLGDEKSQFYYDFTNLYRYYKEAVFVKFAIEQNSPYFYMVFQLSKDINDTKMFKWEMNGDGGIGYYTAPGEHRYEYPNQYDFEWKRASRDMQRIGRHSHYSILDRVFVESIGGDLTIKVEDNTEDGKGIYSEKVEYPDQTLDDCEIHYADLGNLIALKVKPYQEQPRYFVFNDKLQNTQRIDTLSQSGILLPGGQGLIFSNGYYLQTGDYKVFDKTIGNFVYERRITSPNGEDFLFIFYDREKSNYLLLSYNVIEQTVATPIVCNGYTVFSSGLLCYFRREENATKHHVIQIWQTPYIEGDFIPSKHTDNYLYKIGNRDIVRAMAECQELLSLLSKDEAYSNLYYDVTKKSSDILDSYYWINNAGAYLINEPLGDIRQSATAAIEEFEKVQNIKKTTREAIRTVQYKAEELFKTISQTTFAQVDTYVQMLASLRIVRGEVISLRELRYADLPLIEALEKKAAEYTGTLSGECVQFLLRPDALAPYTSRTEERRAEIETIETARQGKQLEEKIDAIGKELELLIEIVSNLKIDDPTQTTKIIDNITSILATLNQVKAAIKRRLRDLSGAEAVAEFAAQAKLLDQSLVNFLDICDTPQKCEEYLTKMMVQLEELESKFAEHDEFTLKITEKREEIYNAFETRKLALVESINKRAAALQTAAERILSGIRNRANSFKEVAQINGFFASDLMIEKVREIIANLEKIGDSNKAGDIQTQLKTIKEDAIRQLRDKQDLFSEGGDAIKLGKHAFAVNRQNLDLTMVLKDGKMFFHLTGTGFFEEVTDAPFLATRPVWEQAAISENTEVYRSEYLAYLVLQEVQQKQLELRSDEVLPYVQQFAANRYNEGYSKGIHDLDAAKLLETLLFLSKNVDLLHFPTQARALAAMYWQRFADETSKEKLNRQLKSAGVLLKIFPNTREFDYLLQQIEQSLLAFCTQTQLFDAKWIKAAAEYLFKEIARHDHFIISGEAHQFKAEFKEFLEKRSAAKLFRDTLESLAANPVEQFLLVRKWLNAFLEQSDKKNYTSFVDEVATLLLLGTYRESWVINVQMETQLAGLHGSHAVIGEGGSYRLDFNAFMRKMEHYTRTVVPQFEHFTHLKKELLDKERVAMRLEEFKPRVLSSFVRNKLIDALYLPIFGDNMAKQIGTVGDNTRTDRMGMLLLISPPGYGKTTLMEYVANRLGLIFMKINGPAIGHRVVSLDPTEADNAAARKELQKLNLALEMGDNVMIYVDDIQHCNPEFLQKFISLTDATRKIEGIYKGITKTYDFRGKRVAVVMAGNPYTETGDKFKIPDMLANRSDIYNLGDIIGDTQDVFELSYIENSMTSNSILQKLAAKSTKDIYHVVQLAQGINRDGIEFEGNHAPQEINEYVEVAKRMIRARDLVLKVNLEYIRSAAMADEYRTEPPFKLQGSYRNMNKLAEKIVPIMNDKEMQTMLLAHYEGESQTLTTGAESNMLKLKELMGVLTEEEAQRWEDIKKTFKKNLLLRGSQSDPMVQVVAQLSHFSDGLHKIQETLQEGIELQSQLPPPSSQPKNNTPTIKFKKS